MTHTRHLFWEDPYQRAFEAYVVEQLRVEGRPAAILDATCFYPTSGGQPHDLGTLNGVAVREVIEGEDGRIVHLLEQPLELGMVRGAIHWARRFDHMQQHSGQHILSQAFEQALGAPTVSFHLGEESCSIDLDLVELTPEQAARVEDLANAVIFENRAITAQEYEQDAVAALALRKAPTVQGRVRVVEVAGFDRCACGGTHVRSAGEIGLVHITRWEKRHGQTRVEFLCGWRALRDYRLRDAAARQLAQGLTVGVEELPAAIARLQEAESLARRQGERLRKRLLDCELPRLAEEAEPLAAGRLLCRILEDYDAGNMRYIAQNLVQQPGMIAFLAVTEPAPQFCFARSADLSGDMGALLRAVAGPLGGKGGGQPHFAQGGGVKAEELATLLERARSQWLASSGSQGRPR